MSWSLSHSTAQKVAIMEQNTRQSKVFADWLKPVLLFLLSAFVVFIALHVFGVIGAAATAPGRAVAKTLSTDNVIASYEWFYDTNAQFDARKSQIKAHSALAKADEDPKERSRLNIELAAMRQSCRDLATKYNANSEKVNKSIFKGGSLPEQLDSAACEV